MAKKKIKFIPLSSVQQNEDNPRTITQEKLEKLIDSICFFPRMMEMRPMITDEDGTLLGGNMRDKGLIELSERINNGGLTEKQEEAIKEHPEIFKNLAAGKIPETWVRKFANLTEKQKKEFIIKDNVSFGSWDFDEVLENWEIDDLTAWAFEFPEEVNEKNINTSDNFDLPSGEKAPFQQITFTLADEQAEALKTALKEVKQEEEFKYCETYGNENGNGNALYYLITKFINPKL